MTNRDRYFRNLNVLLKAMPPGQIDMDRFEAHEQRHGHRFADPSDLVERWLLDQQRRLQGI